MKKKVLLGVLLLGIFSFTACGDAEVTETPDANVEVTTTDEVTVEEPAEEPKATEEVKDLSEWGNKGTYYNDGIEFEMRFAGGIGDMSSVPAVINQSAVGALLVTCRQTDYNFEQRQLEEDFLYQIVDVEGERILDGIEDISSSLRKNRESMFMTVDTTEKMEINGFEMCKYMGEWNFIQEVKDEEFARVCPYVGYAARLSNGTVIYWFYFAYDISALGDESPVTEENCGKIEECATNTAYSLKEVIEE